MDQTNRFDLTLNNYFGPDHNGNDGSVRIEYTNPETNLETSKNFFYHHFNIETSHFPFNDGSFDLVLFCEIIEHLVNDPIHVLMEIKRILKPEGTLIISTPNSAKLENIVKIFRGENVFSPYSLYGPYGRHNREYTIHELLILLDFCGFSVKKIFSKNTTKIYPPMDLECNAIIPKINRKFDLGQYIFIKATKSGGFPQKKPDFLYCNYEKTEKIVIELPRNIDIVDENVGALYYNWHNVELWGNKPARWMRDFAALSVFSENERSITMNFEAISFLKPRKLKVIWGNILVAEREIPCSLTKVKITFKMNEGLNLIKFITPDGSDRPCDVSLLNSHDCRNLSLAFQNIMVK